MNPRSPTIIIYAPSFNALGGGEVWLNRIANGLAERGRKVHVIGKEVPKIPISHHWHPDVELAYLTESAPVSLSASHMSRPNASSHHVARNSLLRVIKFVVDACTGGWRPPGAFLSDIPPSAHESLHRRINDIERAKGTGAAVVLCTDVYTANHVARARTIGAVTCAFSILHQSTFESLSRGTVKAYRNAASKASHLVALTEEDAEAFRRAGVSRVHSIHNPRPESSASSPPGEKAKVVVWMARMIPLKAGPVALRAWARVAPDFPDWRLHLYGDGPERSRLQALAARLHLGHSVEFKGVTNDPHRALAEARIHLITSRFEGWGLGIGEAAIYHVPTVAANTSPGIRMQIEQGVTGLLVTPGSVNDTARALSTLMRDESLRNQMGDAAEVLSGRFDLAAILEEWDRLLS